MVREQNPSMELMATTRPSCDLRVADEGRSVSYRGLRPVHPRTICACSRTALRRLPGDICEVFTVHAARAGHGVFLLQVEEDDVRLGSDGEQRAIRQIGKNGLGPLC
jgi:hypothetical protein